MRKMFLLSAVLLLTNLYSFAQDFSNKGRDFWVGYGYHQVMTTGNGQEMVLYFATEAATNVTVSIPGLGYSVTYSIAANTVFTSNPLPKSGAQDARLLNESAAPENKGIHITSDQPIVAYAHIYNMSVSGATILFPTNTLGREYYSINFQNRANTVNANAWAYVIAADTGTTTVEIIPSQPTLTRAAGVPFTVKLTQGQVYNIMGQFTNAPTGNNHSGVDLTGTFIRSINTGSGTTPDRHVHANRERLWLLAGLMGLFLVGGLVGAAGFKHVGFIFVVPLALVLLTLSLPPLWADRVRLRQLLKGLRASPRAVPPPAPSGPQPDSHETR